MRDVEIRWVHKVIPVPIFWTDSTLSPWQGGYSTGFFCVIRPKYRGKDEGIVQHELQHCVQHYSKFPLHGLMYRFSSAYRLKCELEAYALQLSFYDNQAANAKWMVIAMSIKYDLNFSAEDIQAKFVIACAKYKIQL